MSEDDGRVEVRMVYVGGCPHWQTVGERLRGVLGRMGWTGLPITWVRVETEDEAKAAGLAGSPTVLIGGRDLFSGSTEWSGGFACRLFRESSGRPGAPTADDIMAALNERGG